MFIIVYTNWSTSIRYRWTSIFVWYVSFDIYMVEYKHFVKCFLQVYTLGGSWVLLSRSVLLVCHQRTQWLYLCPLFPRFGDRSPTSQSSVSPVLSFLGRRDIKREGNPVRSTLFVRLTGLHLVDFVWWDCIDDS